MEPLAIMSVCSALNIVNLCIFLLCVWLFVYFVCVDMAPPGSEIKNYYLLLLMNILNSKVTMGASFKTSAARSGEHIQQN